MRIPDIALRATKFASDNSPAILTALGVAGALTTAYLTGKATVKAMQVIRAEEEEARESTGDEYYEIHNRRAVELTWQYYIPAASSAVATVAFIIAANRVGSRRAAALAAAYAISERAMDEYKEKVVEKLGEAKERRIRDEVAQERVSRNPPPVDMIYEETGSVLCCDLFTGRYFLSDMETLRRAENTINYQVTHNYYASLSDFYEQIGLEKTSMSDDFGWNVDKLMELYISTTLTPSGKPCLTMDFKVAPIRGFSRLQ